MFLRIFMCGWLISSLFDDCCLSSARAQRKQKLRKIPFYALDRDVPSVGVTSQTLNSNGMHVQIEIGFKRETEVAFFFCKARIHIFWETGNSCFNRFFMLCIVNMRFIWLNKTTSESRKWFLVKPLFKFLLRLEYLRMCQKMLKIGSPNSSVPKSSS